MKSKFETLGDRLKDYEAQYEYYIWSDKHIVVRIDGHKFSKYTKGFKRPFDEILSKAMEQTTIDLVQEFQAVVGYTQSDEITLVIPSPKPKKVHYNKLPSQDLKHTYSGRIQKIASLTAGFATMAFNRHLLSLYKEQKILEKDLDQTHGIEYRREFGKYMNTIEGKLGKAWFDSRVYAVPNDVEAFNSVLWRVRDAEKNSRSMFAQAHCSHKALQNMSGREQVDFCKETTGEDWDLVDDRYKYGILVKKEKYMKAVDFDQNDTVYEGPEEVERTRLVSFSKHLVFSEENVELIMSKYKG